jgi:hypothetical protein
MQVMYDRCWRITHGLIRGKPEGGVVTLSPDEQLSAMELSGLLQVTQLGLRSKTKAYGPWGDVSTPAWHAVRGAIVGFFGCNKDGYITGIGVWMRNSSPSSVSSEAAGRAPFGSSGYGQVPLVPQFCPCEIDKPNYVSHNMYNLA